MTHLLPGGGLPRAHGARSPVPPRLPLLATPRSVHHLATVAAGTYPPRSPPGTSAAGPVLLACRQWDPLGLARRLPSCGAGAWLSAPLLPWRVQCPVRVCAALAAGLEGQGRRRVLFFLRSSSPVPRSPRCVWRIVPSGCPLPSPAGTPLHVVCAFRGFGPVALLVYPACPLRVCAHLLSRRPRPSSLPGSVWRAHLARFRCRAPVGPFHGVRAPPRFLPRSCALSGLLGRGWPGSVPHSPCMRLCAPLRAGLRVRGIPAPGGPGGGGGTACVLSFPESWRGAPSGGVALPQSVALPSLGRHQSGCYWRRSVHGGRGLQTAPIGVRELILVVVGVAPLLAGAGAPACCGLCGSRRVRAWGRVAYWLGGVPRPGVAALSGGGGTSPWPWGG